MMLAASVGTTAFVAPVSIFSTPRTVAFMQEQPGFQDAEDVKKAAVSADKAGEFCFGLPGSLPPFENFDPFNLLDNQSFEQVSLNYVSWIGAH